MLNNPVDGITSYLNSFSATPGVCKRFHLPKPSRHVTRGVPKFGITSLAIRVLFFSKSPKLR
jgi:hypothetical protein